MNSESDRVEERVENIDLVDNQLNFFDLSSHGVACLFTKNLEVGAFVTVKLNAIVCKAIVRHTTSRLDGYRVGLEFIEVSPEMHASINALVDAYSKGVELKCGIVGEIGRE